MPADERAALTRPKPTPIAGAFLGACFTAIHRGVALGDLVDTIHDAGLAGPWVTWAELNSWVRQVDDLQPRPDIPDDDWLDHCANNRIDPVSGTEIVLTVVDR